MIQDAKTLSAFLKTVYHIKGLYMSVRLVGLHLKMWQLSVYTCNCLIFFFAGSGSSCLWKSPTSSHDCLKRGAWWRQALLETAEKQLIHSLLSNYFSMRDFYNTCRALSLFDKAEFWSMFLISDDIIENISFEYHQISNISLVGNKIVDTQM